MVNRNRLEDFMKARRDLNLIVDESMIFMDMTNNIVIQKAVSQIIDRGVEAHCKMRSKSGSIKPKYSNTAIFGKTIKRRRRE